MLALGGRARVVLAFFAGAAIASFLSISFLLSNTPSSAGWRIPAGSLGGQLLFGTDPRVPNDKPYELIGRESLRVAVEEAAGHHEEVFGALLYTLSRLPHTAVSFYRDAPLRFSFSETLATFFPAKPLSLEQLYTDLARNRTPGTADAIDVLISTTCEITLRRHGDALLEAWDSRPRNDKFRLVCVIHHSNTVFAKDLEPVLRPWALRGTLSFVALSPHVSDSLRQTIGWEMEKSGSTLRDVPYDACPVYTFVPLFPYDLNLTSSRDTAPRDSRRISNVAIQGNLQQGRRDYTGLFAQLEESIREDPHLWGYLPSSSTSAMLDPDTTAADRFVLHLIGQGQLQVPASLTHAVTLHVGLSYPDFYSLLTTMDVLLPDFGNRAYYENMASSSIPAALIGHVSIMSTALLMEKYSYLDTRTTVLRPATSNDLEAIAALRTHGRTLISASAKTPEALVAYELLQIPGSASKSESPSGSTSSGSLGTCQPESCEELDAWSWPRAPTHMASYREDVYSRNEEEMARVLRGIGEQSTWTTHPQL